MVDSLRQRKIYYLSQLAASVQENRWSQSWLPTKSFELSKQEEEELTRYIGILNLSQVQLWDKEDDLILDSAPSGKYTPKEGYLKLSVPGFEQGIAWWWKKLCKIHSPPKRRLFW